MRLALQGSNGGLASLITLLVLPGLSLMNPSSLSLLYAPALLDVNTGQGMIKNVAKSDDGLAAILGHELAHYTEGHLVEDRSISRFFKNVVFVAKEFSGFQMDPAYLAQSSPFQKPHLHDKEFQGLKPPTLLILADYKGLIYMAKVSFRDFVDETDREGLL